MHMPKPDVHTMHQTGYSIPDQKRLQFAVIQSFSGVSSGELSLTKHDIVSVIENSPSGWSWVNEPNVGSGWFPTDYLEPLVFPKKKDLAREQESSEESQGYLDVVEEDAESQYIYASAAEIMKVKKDGHYKEYEAKAYRASHSYSGGNEDELAFKENETILVLQETDTGWWRGSTYLGEGWFPATFVQDASTCEDTTTQPTVNADHPSFRARASSYETIDAEYPPDCYHVSNCNKYSQEASPYEVTQLVSKKSQASKDSDREIVHQVPPVISQQAVNKHLKSRGKSAFLKPLRPAPPRPAAPRFSAALQPSANPDGLPPPAASHAPATPRPSPARPSPARPSPARPTLATQHSATPPPSTTSLPPTYPAAPPSTATSRPSAAGSPSAVPPPSTSLPPIYQAAPLPQVAQISQAPLAEENDTRKQEKEDSKEPGTVEGVVIVHPRKQSETSLSKLIKVTNRRSIINPNPLELPPNRPVPIPPPRKARNPPNPSDNHRRPRPVPRNLGNKKAKSNILNMDNVPNHGPERPPPPVPGKLIDRKRASSGLSVFSNDSSIGGQQLNKEYLPRKQSSSENEQNNENKPDVSTSITSNDSDIVENTQNKKMASAHPRKVSPKPKPRKHSQEQLNGIQILNMAYVPIEYGKDGRKEEQIINPIPVRTQSLSEEFSQPSEVKPRPQVKPRSKSLANLFSATHEDNVNRGNFEKETSSESRSRLQSSPQDNFNADHDDDSQNHKYMQYDKNQNIVDVNPIKPSHSPPRSPPKPKPKTRTKQNYH